MCGKYIENDANPKSKVHLNSLALKSVYLRSVRGVRQIVDGNLWIHLLNQFLILKTMVDYDVPCQTKVQVISSKYKHTI